MRFVPAVAFFVLSVLVAAACLFRPTLNGDQFLAAVAAEVLTGSTPEQAYEKVEPRLGPIYGQFHTHQQVLYMVHYHTVKVLHVGGIALLERLGVPMRHAVILVSCLAYVLAGVFVWLWLRATLSGWWLTVAALMLMLLPLPVQMARMGVPDALTAAFVLGGLYFAVQVDKPVIAMLMLLLAVWTRFDSVIYCGVFLIVLMATSVVPLRLGVISGTALLASAMGIYLIGHNRHALLASIPEAGWSSNPLRNLATVEMGPLVVYTIFAVACWRLSRSGFEKSLCVAGLCGVAIHFALFPVPLDRYFAPVFFLWAVLGIPYIFGAKSATAAAS